MSTSPLDALIVGGAPMDVLHFGKETTLAPGLAEFARGEHPVMAAHAGVALAAKTAATIGMEQLTLRQPVPIASVDDRCRLVPDQIQRMARLLAHLPHVRPFDFTGDFYPPAGHLSALNFFFAAALQQFGFWEMHDGRYYQPLVALIEGHLLKGSKYLWCAYRRQLDRDPDFFLPTRQAVMTETEMADAFRSDNGTNPLPALELHLQAARAYGFDMQVIGWTPAAMMLVANQSNQPRSALLDILTHIGGYKEDPLRKKAVLLALILEQRPERFLRPAQGEPEPPAIDYHLMRSCLRIGLIDIRDAKLHQQVIEHDELATEDEWAIRSTAYRAIQQVRDLSEQTMGMVDWFFFGARHRCPEMTEPDCTHCVIDAICAHRKELFQPVIRTTFY